MMLKSNYDTRLDGVGDAATAGVANGKIIICKHDSKLKKIGKSTRRATPLDRYPVFGSKSDSKASQMVFKIQPISRKKRSNK